jgi:hypothetical protein
MKSLGFPRLHLSVSANSRVLDLFNAFPEQHAAVGIDLGRQFASSRRLAAYLVTTRGFRSAALEHPGPPNFGLRATRGHRVRPWQVPTTTRHDKPKRNLPICASVNT